jgi:hypothetical protein
MAVFVKPRRRAERPEMAMRIRVAIPEDTPRNRKLLLKKANYQGRGAPGTKIVKEFYDQNTGTSVLRAV